MVAILHLVSSRSDIGQSLIGTKNDDGGQMGKCGREVGQRSRQYTLNYVGCIQHFAVAHSHGSTGSMSDVCAITCY